MHGICGLLVNIYEARHITKMSRWMEYSDQKAGENNEGDNASLQSNAYVVGMQGKLSQD